MPPSIVAVIGFRRAGKDTVAEHLVRAHGFALLKFAAPLKAAAKALFGFSDDQLEHTKDQVDPTWGVTPRHIMQVLGTEIVQYQLPKYVPGLGRDLFARALLKNVERFADDARIVVSDMRFSHEYAALRKRFGNICVVRVVRQVPTIDEDAHASEREHLEINADFVLENDESICALHQKVDDIMRRLYA